MGQLDVRCAARAANQVRKWGIYKGTSPDYLSGCPLSLQMATGFMLDGTFADYIVGFKLPLNRSEFVTVCVAYTVGFFCKLCDAYSRGHQQRRSYTYFVCGMHLFITCHFVFP